MVESRCGAVAVGRTYLLSASFVWGCLSGSALTPFPHPAHRTGQADLPHPALGVGWDRVADRASNDADVSSIPPIIPYGGFSPVRLEGWRFGRRLPNASLSSSLLPAYADHVLVCFRPSCIPSYPRMSRSVSGRLRADAPPWRVGNPPPQGSSLESGLCCPGLSSLNRPHPPHSQAHHDFAARRLIRNAARLLLWRNRTCRMRSSVLSKRLTENELSNFSRL